MGDVVEKRTSGLKAPVLLLTGHDGEVYCLEFSGNGQLLASGAKDKSILLFEVYGECRNIGVLSGHKNAILELHWSANSDFLYCCSADHCASLWDVEYQKRLQKYGECAVPRTNPRSRPHWHRQQLLPRARGRWGHAGHRRRRRHRQGLGQPEQAPR
ncbi:U5 snRNP-specific 40 kDa protein, putative [Babesia caballi]|uniref:U5 snRNP-specific 40 kDa protein, putative n=1 Tax=Babesia caballi TaxID=5871 RepID=A0AAV4LXB9_BABCB|nr:U5 snRNP-specific 40 kDa protein, putative [Babesia caballi]